MAASATLVVLVLTGAVLPAAAGAQDGCPRPPAASEIDQYVDDLPAVCPEVGAGAGTDGGSAEAGLAPTLPFTGLAVVALAMAGTLMAMAGLAIRRRRERAGGER